MVRPAALSPDEIAVALGELEGWTDGGGRLRREIVFANFPAAIAFMALVAFDAERLDHHPNWSNVYNRVTIELWTHDVGAITRLDIDLAVAIDRAARQLSR